MNQRIRGLLFMLVTTVLWAFNGNMVALLTGKLAMSPELLVVLRLGGSGILLLILYSLTNRKKGLTLIKKAYNIKPLLLYALAGILLMQYSYTIAIMHSNAPTGALLEYFGVFLIIGFIAFQNRRPPQKIVFFALIICMAGIFLLIAGGDLKNLEINSQALLWGMLAAIGYAIFNLAPLRLQERYESIEIVGFGMLIAGASLYLITRPSFTNLNLDLGGYLALAYCIIGGTFIPFVTYMEGQKRAGAEAAGIFGLTEPMFSALIGVVLYGLQLNFTDIVGMLLVIGSVGALTVKKEN